jgi:hypothetical protein
MIQSQALVAQRRPHKMIYILVCLEKASICESKHRQHDPNALDEHSSDNLSGPALFALSDPMSEKAVLVA